MTFLEHINSGAVLVSDGAWGTFLQNKGLKTGECPELWNDSHPDDIVDIGRAYIDAGADIILTNSFGGNAIKLKHYQLDDRAAELNEKAAVLARQAAGSEKYVLGSVGPTGKILMMGDVSEDELYQAFAIQTAALAKGGVDAILVETMSALDEANLAIKAAKENTALPVICTFTFERTSDNTYRTMMGVSPTQMAEAVLSAGVSVIGTNCGNGMARMVDIVKEQRAAAPEVLILVHANAGSPVIKDGKTVFPETPHETASYVNAVIDAGATIVGGCCGTTPEHITAIAQVVKERR